jgi:glycosyltransferase involved in cell wall biosynthesis
VLFSVIVPTFGRPGEVRELLSGFTEQRSADFEVIIVDGSPDSNLKDIVEGFKDKINIRYIYEKGMGISDSRNLGAEKAHGDYLVFMDSDCIAAPDYFNIVSSFLAGNRIDGFAGPDKAHPSFSKVQKAINYAMTSHFTTGGIRGQKIHIGRIQLRGFNMGISKEAFSKIGGFSGLKAGEDIDISLRFQHAGYTAALIHDAFVYHKRKTNFLKFFVQLFLHGKARIDLFKKHSRSLKPVYFLPSVFVIYIIAGVAAIFFCKYCFLLFLVTMLLYCLLIFTDASVRNRSIAVGLLSVYASIIMLIAYGSGFIYNFARRVIFRSKKESIRPKIIKE